MTEPDAPDNVSRETEDEAKENGKQVFGDGYPMAEEYASLLAGDGVVRGLIGPREVGRVWERHLLNCAVLGELVTRDADVLDIGSGAGLPGIPLAIARPDIWVTLVEPMERRVTFLNEVVETLKLPNVEVLRARADAVSPKGKADVVTSRAVAPLLKLAHWCLPLARRGGEVLAIKGASAPDEVSKYLAANRKNAAHKPRVVECGAGLLTTPTTVIRLVR
ncbi:MAG TPA: 16S rRNA (guanine(527)-N(7))-methyltransferase RsmG [Candidatus Stackebrandtia excrementipullorum]|nr:16S rRNA (guanine(527)-N(7))-methyltransferase RsmG [Candidatus Stackebrandtia excrementipullorum]